MSLESAAYLAAVIASSNDAIIGMDLSGRITDWNDAAEYLFGYKAADMIGSSVFRIVPPEREEEERAFLVRLGAGEHVSHFATERITADGRIVPVSLTLSPIRDAAGKIVGISKTTRDLTEVQRREAVLASILNTVPDALVIADKTGIIQSFSPAASRIFGYAPEEIIGANVSVLVPAPRAAEHDSYIARYLQTGENRIIGIGRVLEARRKDGTVFPMELQVGEVRTAGTHLFTGFVRDLSERFARERHMAELQSELVHASRLSDLGQMASALAHEVNQPLTAIGNYVNAAKRVLGADAPPMIAEVLTKVAEQTERARKIVQGLRGLVKKEAASDRHPESVSAIIEETAALVLAGSRGGARLNWTIAPDLPPIDVDRVQIQQVLINLLRNAIEALRDQADRRVTIVATGAKEQVTITVADNGPGFSPAVREHLFQPFVTSKSDGLGVGLSICRSIAEAHGGMLTAEDGPDGGAVFILTLPISGL